MTLAEIIASAVARHGKKFPPAGDAALSSAEMTLAALGGPGLPDDYVMFLKESDGLVFHHISFLGSADIAGAQEDLFRGRRKPHFLGIGQADGDVYAYDTRSRTYKILDVTDCAEFGEFPTIAELIEKVTGN